jgi:hypothetical protein
MFKVASATFIELHRVYPGLLDNRIAINVEDIGVFSPDANGKGSWIYKKNDSEPSGWQVSESYDQIKESIQGNTK